MPLHSPDLLPQQLLSIEAPSSPLSSRPKRTRISCHAALDKAACAPFREERRMKSDNATKFYRKSGGAKWRDLQFTGPLLEMFFGRVLVVFRPTQGDEKRLLFPSLVIALDGSVPSPLSSR